MIKISRSTLTLQLPHLELFMRQVQSEIFVWLTKGAHESVFPLHTSFFSKLFGKVVFLNILSKSTHKYLTVSKIGTFGNVKWRWTCLMLHEKILNYGKWKIEAYEILLSLHISSPDNVKPYIYWKSVGLYLSGIVKISITAFHKNFAFLQFFLMKKILIQL